MPITGLSPSPLHLPLAETPSASVPRDVAISNHLTKGQCLRLTGSWLNQQKARLTSGHLQLLKVALGALDGREAVSNIQQDEIGGHFDLARPSYGASNIQYQRQESAPDTLGFLSINDGQGKPLLRLGDPRLLAVNSTDTEDVDYRADEPSILAHSRRDPHAAWQNTLYIVPFFTSQGEKAKVVGDYMKGDLLRFEVKNKDGDSYAVLKRTQLDNGQPVWMLPNHAGLIGGADEFSNLPDEAFGILGNTRVEQAGWSLAGLDFFDNTTHDAQGNCWIRGDISEDGKTVKILGLMNDSEIRNGIDLSMYKVCKENPDAKIIFDASVEVATDEKMKSKYKMKPTSDGSALEGNAKDLLKIAKNQLESYGWKLR
jgi:hypothetical protein